MPREINDRIHTPGDYCWEGDCSFAQFHFLQSIEQTAPEVLINLRTSVLPLWKKHPLLSFAWPDRKKDRRALVATTLPVFQAIWQWAVRHNLIAVSDLPLLTSDPGMCLAFHMLNRSYLDRAHPFIGIDPFSETSPTLVFGLRTLLRVVAQTLDVWAKRRSDHEPVWTFPKPDFTTPSDSTALEELQTLDAFLADPVFGPMIDSGEIISTDIGGFVYKFIAKGWDPRQESRAHAEDRITNALAAELKRNLDAHERLAKKVHLGRVPIKKQLDHYVWLTHFQVKGLSYPEVTRLVNKDSEVPDEIDSDKFVKATKTIRYGVKHSAKLVVGPKWKTCWLRVESAGRPRRS